jgi:hypothetical protein
MSDMGNEFGGKRGEKPSEKPEPKGNPKPKPKPISFHCDHCGRDGHKEEFCFRKRREERFAREMAKKDTHRTSRGVPEPRVVPRGEAVLHTIPTRARHEFPTQGVLTLASITTRFMFSATAPKMLVGIS